MLFLLSGIILSTSILLIVSFFKLRRLSEIILAWSLLAFTNLVLVFQIANLFSKLNNPYFILILQSVVLAICLTLWLLNKRPKLFPDIQIHIQLKAFLKNKRNWPIIVLFGSLVFILIIYLILIYIVPPNNNDALSIHIARVLKWKQFGSYFPWVTPSIWQVTFPVNAQLTYLWTILFTNSDHFIAYIPFMAGLNVALLVSLLAYEMGFDKRSSLFAGLIWLTFPVVQLHLTSVRHDLISTWLFVTCIYFFHRWGSSQQITHMILSALALGLVVGTNLSIATYLPGLVIMLAIWFFTRQYSIKQLLLWGAAVLLVFLLLSSPIYISNMIHFNSPVGPDASEMTSVAVTNEMNLGRYLQINITRWCYQFIDFSGLPQPLAQAGINAKAWLAERLSTLLQIDLEGDLATMNKHIFSWRTLYQLQEDEAWYGLIGVGLVFPTALAAFYQGIKKRNVLFLAPLIFLFTGMITCSLIRPGWTPYDGRYFMPLAAICAALLPMWFMGKKSAVYIQYFVLLIALCSALMVLVFNPAKQIVGGAAIWNMNRIDRMTRQSYTSKEMLYLVEGAIPEDGIIGVATNNIYYQEYGIYGEHFTRTVMDVFPPEKISDANWLQQRNINYLLILVSPGYPEQIAEGYEYKESLGDWVVYAVHAQE